MIKELEDGTEWVKATYYKKDMILKGTWEVSIKIDGVRVIKDKNGNAMSRSSKPIKHLEKLKFTDSEFYYKNWNTSMGILSSDDVLIEPRQEMLYSLDPIDKRLDMGKIVDPTHEQITEYLNKVLAKGYEGVVLRQGTKWLKVVPEAYMDVKILDIVEGTGKYKGMCGAIKTSKGDVGSFRKINNMSDTYLRRYLLRNRKTLKGTIIQVAYRELTVNGLFKFPSLVKLRTDKHYEDFGE